MPIEPGANPVKVLHVVGDSRFGGIAQIIEGLGATAKAEGWQPDVLTTDPTVQAFVREAGMGVVDLDVIRRPIRPLRDLLGSFRLYRFLRRSTYQIVHTHTSKGGFVGRLAAYLARVPVVVHTVHGFAFHERSSRLAIRFYAVLERIAAHWCDRIISVSEFHRRWALELGICRPGRIVAIPNGTKPPEMSAGVKPEAIRAQLGVRRSDLLIFNTARLAADKGIAYLIEAAAKLAQRHRRFRVVIAGDGPAREQLETLAADLRVRDLVTFLGFRQDVSELLRAADLIVFPTLREGLSISLLEAMAAGKPIIATSIGCVRDLASQSEMARLVPPADSTALADAIRTVADHPELMTRLGDNARRLFAARYTEGRMLSGYRRLYHQLMRQKCPAKVTRVRLAEKSSSVRSATPQDLPQIVGIHQRSFREFFLTQLGRRFLHEYYELVLGYQSGIILTCEQEGSLQGFVCGFVNPAEFYRLMWRRKSSFMPPMLSAVLRHPSLAGKILSGIERLHTSVAQPQPRTCELSSIAVAPEATGNGLGISLVRAFLSRSWGMNAQYVSLTTDAEGNDDANRLYRDAGFSVARRFLQRKDRWMNEYVIARTSHGFRQEVLE
jgi:glycosyltransferase involved in cell wall biosynthesis/ribosomal protein S18 acetylase RimI-like enzyme